MSLQIPNATIKRLALYRRCFVELDEMGVKRIQSSELSHRIGIDSATIRRDFSYLGELGRQGYGYEVRVVLQAFNEILNATESQNCILIGVGNLGRALSNYFSSDKFRTRLFRTPVNLVAGFDINESIVGSRVGELPLYHLDELQLFIRENNVKYAILTLPASGAKKVATILDGSGIKGILNLSSTVINVSSDITVHEVDLNMELETLFFYVFQKEQTK